MKWMDGKAEGFEEEEAKGVFAEESESREPGRDAGIWDLME